MFWLVSIYTCYYNYNPYAQPRVVYMRLPTVTQPSLIIHMYFLILLSTG